MLDLLSRIPSLSSRSTKRRQDKTTTSKSDLLPRADGRHYSPGPHRRQGRSRSASGRRSSSVLSSSLGKRATAHHVRSASANSRRSRSKEALRGRSSSRQRQRGRGHGDDELPQSSDCDDPGRARSRTMQPPSRWSSPHALTADPTHFLEREANDASARQLDSSRHSERPSRGHGARPRPRSESCRRVTRTGPQPRRQHSLERDVNIPSAKPLDSLYQSKRSSRRRGRSESGGRVTRTTPQPRRQHSLERDINNASAKQLDSSCHSERSSHGGGARPRRRLESGGQATHAHHQPPRQHFSEREANATQKQLGSSAHGKRSSRGRGARPRHHPQPPHQRRQSSALERGANAPHRGARRKRDLPDWRPSHKHTQQHPGSFTPGARTGTCGSPNEQQHRPWPQQQQRRQSQAPEQESMLSRPLAETCSGQNKHECDDGLARASSPTSKGDFQPLHQLHPCCQSDTFEKDLTPSRPLAEMSISPNKREDESHLDGASSPASHDGLALETAASKRQQSTQRKVLQALHAAGVDLGVSQQELESLQRKNREEFGFAEGPNMKDMRRGRNELHNTGSGNPRSFSYYGLDGTYLVAESVGGGKTGDGTMEASYDNKGATFDNEDPIEEKSDCLASRGETVKERRIRGLSKSLHDWSSHQGNASDCCRWGRQTGRGGMMENDSFDPIDDAKGSTNRGAFVEGVARQVNKKGGRIGSINEKKKEHAANIGREIAAEKRGDNEGMAKGDAEYTEKRGKSDHGFSKSMDFLEGGYATSGCIDDYTIEVVRPMVREHSPSLAHCERVRSLPDLLPLREAEIVNDVQNEAEPGIAAEVTGSIGYLICARKKMQCGISRSLPLAAHHPPSVPFHERVHSLPGEFTPREDHGEYDDDDEGKFVLGGVKYPTLAKKGSQFVIPPPPPRRSCPAIDLTDPPPCLPKSTKKITHSRSGDGICSRGMRERMDCHKGDSFSMLRALAMEFRDKGNSCNNEKEQDAAQGNEDWDTNAADYGGNWSGPFGRDNCSGGMIDNYGAGLPFSNRSCSAFVVVERRTFSSIDGGFSSLCGDATCMPPTPTTGEDSLVDSATRCPKQGQSHRSCQLSETLPFVRLSSKAPSAGKDVDSGPCEREQETDRNVLEALQDLEASGVHLGITEEKLKNLFSSKVDDDELNSQWSDIEDSEEEKKETSDFGEDCSVRKEERNSYDENRRCGVKPHGPFHAVDNDISDTTMAMMQSSERMAGGDEVCTQQKSENNDDNRKNSIKNSISHDLDVAQAHTKFDAVENHVIEVKVIRPAPDLPHSSVHIHRAPSMPTESLSRRYRVDNLEEGEITHDSTSEVPGSTKKESKIVIPPPPPRHSRRDVESDLKKFLKDNGATAVIDEPPISKCFGDILRSEVTEIAEPTVATPRSSGTQSTEEEDFYQSPPFDHFWVKTKGYDGKSGSSGNSSESSPSNKEEADADSLHRANSSGNHNGSRKQRMPSESLLRDTSGGMNLASVPECSTECRINNYDERQEEGELDFANKIQLEGKKRQHFQQKQCRTVGRQKKQLLAKAPGFHTPPTSPLDHYHSSGSNTSAKKTKKPYHRMPPPPFLPTPQSRKLPSRQPPSSSQEEECGWIPNSIRNIDNTPKNQTTVNTRQQKQHPCPQRNVDSCAATPTTRQVKIKSSGPNKSRFTKLNSSTSSSVLPPPPPRRRKSSTGSTSVSGAVKTGSANIICGSDYPSGVLAANLSSTSSWRTGGAARRRSSSGNGHRESVSMQQRRKSIHQEKKSGNASVSSGSITSGIEI